MTRVQHVHGGECGSVVSRGGREETAQRHVVSVQSLLELDRGGGCQHPEHSNATEVSLKIANFTLFELHPN